MLVQSGVTDIVFQKMQVLFHPHRIEVLLNSRSGILGARTRITATLTLQTPTTGSGLNFFDPQHAEVSVLRNFYGPSLLTLVPAHLATESPSPHRGAGALQ